MPRLSPCRNVELDAERATVDLRRAQLDEFEQLLVDAGLGGRLRQRQHDLRGVGRQRAVVLLFAACMWHFFIRLCCQDTDLV